MSSNQLPDQDLVERIDDDLREILSKHRPEAMPPAIQEQIHAIHTTYDGC
jgi:hypothetical protein